VETSIVSASIASVSKLLSLWMVLALYRWNREKKAGAQRQMVQKEEVRWEESRALNAGFITLMALFAARSVIINRTVLWISCRLSSLGAMSP
jgi:hypothetical protein